jgi:hypothetical protein
MRQRRAVSTTIMAVVVTVVVLAVGTVFLAYSSTPRSVSTVSTNTTFTPSNSKSSSSSATACLSSSIATTSTNESAIFNLQTMPSNFSVGNYRFVMVYNGTDYTYTSNGVATANSGYNLVFNITRGSETQVAMFGSAPPAPYPPTVPSPSTATAFDGNVHMQWVATCNAMFLEITTITSSASVIATNINVHWLALSPGTLLRGPLITARSPRVARSITRLISTASHTNTRFNQSIRTQRALMSSRFTGTRRTIRW